MDNLHIKYETNIDKNGITLTAYERRKWVIVPETIDDKSITHIGKQLFQHTKNVKSITLPDSLECIRSFAFDGCTNHQTIEIPNNVSSGGRFAFRRCTNLRSIRLSTLMTEMKMETFKECTHLEKSNRLRTLLK